MEDVLDAELSDLLQVASFCTSRSARTNLRESLVAAGIPKKQAKKIVKALRRYLCQDEAVCFSSSGGFPVGVAMGFNARWANNVMVHKSGPLIVGGYLPRGSTLASQEKRAWLVP